MSRRTYRRRTFACADCDLTVQAWAWDTEVVVCPSCQVGITEALPPASRGPTVIGDACDVVIEHGICWPGGAPRRYTSKAEMRAEAKARGLVNYVRHIPPPGTDKSPFTRKWD
jgi:hypothetical protein